MVTVGLILLFHEDNSSVNNTLSPEIIWKIRNIQAMNIAVHKIINA